MKRLALFIVLACGSTGYSQEKSYHQQPMDSWLPGECYRSPNYVSPSDRDEGRGWRESVIDLSNKSILREQGRLNEYRPGMPLVQQSPTVLSSANPPKQRQSKTRHARKRSTAGAC